MEHAGHVLTAVRRLEHIHELLQRGGFQFARVRRRECNTVERVGVDDRLVQDTVLGGRDRSQHEAQESVQVDHRAAQHFAFRRVLAANGLGQVERVDAELALDGHGDEGSSHGLAEVGVFVFRVDDEDVGSQHQVAQDLQLRGVGFTRSGRSEEVAVRVREVEAVEDHKGIVVAVDAVEDTVVVCQVAGREREAGRQRTRIHVAVDLQVVLGDGQRGVPCVFHLEVRGLRQHQLSSQQGLYIRLYFLQLLFILRIQRDVHAELEELLLAAGQEVAQFLGILQGGFQRRIAHDAALFQHAHGGAEFRHLLAKHLHDRLVGAGVDELGDIERRIQVHRLAEPVGIDVVRPVVDVQRAGEHIVHHDVLRADLHAGRRDNIQDFLESFLVFLDCIAIFVRQDVAVFLFAQHIDGLLVEAEQFVDRLHERGLERGRR